MAYEVHLVTADGGTRAVDPAHHVFHTGDRFQVLYRPTLPGRVRVSNVDPSGNESSIDDQDVAAAQLASLGPYEFVGSKGAETLRLVMAPCSTPQLAAVTRSIVKTTAASATTSTPAIADCNDPRTRGMHRKTRSIERTGVQGATAFGLDALSKDELQSGVVDPRVVLIALQHK
jgi:hypothetical protein